MLGGVMSAQDEEEVEEELAALEAEAAARTRVQQPLPNVPDTQLPTPQIGAESPESLEAEQAKQPEQRQAMLA